MPFSTMAPPLSTLSVLRIACLFLFSQWSVKFFVLLQSLEFPGREEIDLIIEACVRHGAYEKLAFLVTKNASVHNICDNGIVTARVESGFPSVESQRTFSNTLGERRVSSCC